MENIGTVLPTLGTSDNNVISFIIQILAFIVIAGIVIYMIKVYFKNIELKKNPEKNQAEIKENFEKIQKIKKWFVKIGGIIFAIVIMTTIILSNFR